MDQTTTTTTVQKHTTRTKVSEGPHVENLRATMRRLNEELLAAREATRAEVDRLDLMRELVDDDALNGLLTTIEELEITISENERRIGKLQAELDGVNEEYEAEQGRLTKLWDAYKVQEEELRRMQRDEPLLKERLADRDRQINELEDEVAKLRSMETYKERYSALSRDHDRLRESYREMEEDLIQRNETIAQLEAKMESLKSYEDDSRKVRDLEKQLNEEKERLAKLYKVYEDTEAKLAEAEADSHRWRQWYDRHRQAFEMVGGAAQYPVSND